MKTGILHIKRIDLEAVKNILEINQQQATFNKDNFKGTCCRLEARGCLNTLEKLGLLTEDEEAAFENQQSDLEGFETCDEWYSKI